MWFSQLSYFGDFSLTGPNHYVRLFPRYHIIWPLWSCWSALLLSFCFSFTAHILTVPWFMSYTQCLYVIVAVLKDSSLSHGPQNNSEQKKTKPSFHTALIFFSQNAHSFNSNEWTVHDPAGRDQSLPVLQWLTQPHVKSPCLGHWARLAAVIYEALWNFMKSCHVQN